MKLLNVLKLSAALLMPCVAMFAAAKPCQAAVSVVVTHTGSETVDAGEDLDISFTATLSGKPVEHNECQISNLVYNWTVTITSSEGTVVSHPTGATINVSQTASNSVSSYTVSASCTVTYDQTECGPETSGSATGGDSGTVEVNPDLCPADEEEDG